MLEREIRPAQKQYDWPDNYYMETDSRTRKTYLDAALAEDDSEENRLRLLLWEKRYTNSHGNIDGTDYFLKQWINLPFAKTSHTGLFGGKNKENKSITELRDTFQLQILVENDSCKDIWYREFMNFCCFYIQLSKTDKTYSTTAFGLARLPEDTLTKKLADDLCERTIYLPKKLGISQELSLLAKAAKDSFTLYYPDYTAVYDRIAKKASEK